MLTRISVKNRLTAGMPQYA